MRVSTAFVLWERERKFDKMKRILFEGDSITDSGRAREGKMDNLGNGYPTLVKAELGFDHPSEYYFMNRGLSGDRSVDIYAKIKIDIINLKPDVLSILMGVNDVWHEYEIDNGVEPDKFEKIYCMLIEEIKEALPDIKIMILEPFVLKGTATEHVWEGFSSKVYELAKRARRVAEKYDLKFVPLQEKFDQMLDLMPAEYWLGDGVHPTSMGHELIKRAWMQGFEQLRGDR